jgi:two-component system, response regulator
MNNTIIDILLVEDREEDAELTMMALKNHKLANNILWVKDGEEALHFLFGTGTFQNITLPCRPRMVLLDLKMPKVDGIEVLRAIRSSPDTKTLPVIILTTSREEKDVVAAYNLHANSYIVKPVGFDKFTDSVKELGMYWLLLNEPPIM